MVCVGSRLAEQSLRRRSSGDQTDVDRVRWCCRRPGLLRERATGMTDRTWSLGGEYSVTPRLALTLETLGSRRTHSLLQLGMRHNVIPDMLDDNVAYGQRWSTRGSERFVAIGLTFVRRVLP